MTVDLGEKIDAPTARANIAAKPRIRAGIVGAGLMGRWHAHALEKAGGEVVGFADFAAAKARGLAAKYPMARAFDDAEKMLAEQNLDVLHVCSPTGSHEAIAETAIEVGVHLLIEKPFAESAEQTSRLYDLAARRNSLLCPVHQFAFQDGAAKARKHLPRIGRLVHLEANICSAGGAGFAAEQMDSTAVDILPHPLSVMQKFLDEDITAAGWNVGHPVSGELRVFGQIKETSLSIFVSMNSRPTTNTFRIFGTNGAIHLDFFHGFSIFEPGGASRPRKILHPFDLAARSFSAATVNLARRTARRESAYPGLRQLIEKFYKSIKLKSEPPITSSEAVAVAEIRDLVINRIINRKQ